MSVVADTSIWVDWLRLGRTGPAAALERLLERRALVICGPVAAELIAGTARDRADELWLLLASLPWADLDALAWREVGAVAAALRHTGASVPLTDVAIAVAAMRADAELWTRDDDFRRIREVAPALRLRRDYDSA